MRLIYAIWGSFDGLSKHRLVGITGKTIEDAYDLENPTDLELVTVKMSN